MTLPNGAPGEDAAPAPLRPAEVAAAGRRAQEGVAYRRAAYDVSPSRGHDERVWRSEPGSTPATVLAVNAGGPRPSPAVRVALEEGVTLTLEQYRRAEAEGAW